MPLVVVTGGNRGLGRAYIEHLLRDSSDWKVVFTAREVASGEQAKAEIAELTGAHDRLFFKQLDIESTDSIIAFRDALAAEFEGIDVLISNAAIYIRNATTEDAARVLKVNFEKTAEFVDTLLPLVKPTGQVIVVSSTLGNRSHNNNEAVKAKVFAEDLTKAEIFEIYQELQADVAAGTATEKGWNADSYFNSKFLINAFVRVVAKELKAAQSTIRINAICPGWCRTDMGGPTAPRSPEEGVQTYLYLTKQDSDVSGQFWTDSAVAPF